MPLRMIVEVMLPIVALVAAGGLWAVRARGESTEALRAQLNRMVLYVFAPALMFSIASATAITAALLTVPLLLALGVALTGVLLYLLLYRSALGRNLSNPARAALMLSGMFGNVFYLGFPVTSFLYGAPGGLYAAFADMGAATPLLWSLGVWIATRLGSDRAAHAAHAPLWRVMGRQPPVWAFLIGVAAQQSGLELAPLVRATALIGQATIPVMMFVLGLSIPWTRLRPSAPILGVVAVKLAIMPLIVWAFAHWWFAPLSEAPRAAVIEAAMPTMLMGVLMADRFALDTRAAALMIGWSTVLFWFTLPLWLALAA